MDKEHELDPNLGMTEHEKIKHDQALFRDAKIDRHVSHGDAQRKANRALEDLAGFIQHDSSEAPILKNAIYMGSAAVHVYTLPGIQETFFVCQTAPMRARASEVLASDATTDLRRQLRIAYGRAGGEKRSGF